MNARTLAVALAAAALSCAPKQPHVELFGICLAPKDPTTCTFASTCDTYLIGNPEVDLDQRALVSALIGPILLTVEVHNQLPNNAAPDAGRVNTNDAFVRETLMELEGTGLSSSTPMQQVVPAAGTAVLGLTPFSAQTEADLAPFVPAGQTVTVVADIWVKGVTADGASFESPKMKVPFRACRGCFGALATCPPTSTFSACPPSNLGTNLVSTRCE